MDDGGVNFSDVATILWDHGTSKLKSSSVITGSYVDTTYTAGNSGLVPAVGTAGHFLRHDGTFGIPAYTTNTNTTYTYAIANGTTKLTLNPDAGSGQDIEIVGAGSVTVARTNASKLTITGASSYTLPTSSSTTLGGVKIGGGITITAGVISADTQAGTYSLPLSSSSVRGGAKVGYTEVGKNYPVELSSEKMYVNVPWSDTVYSLSLAPIHTATSTTGNMLSENSVIDCGSVTWGS